MIDLLLQIGLSNACFALALAIMAMFVGVKAKRPYLAHLLWVLVFVKLVTPPLAIFPVSFSATPAPVVFELDVAAPSAISETAAAASLWSNVGVMLNAAKPLLATIWLLGSVIVFAWSMLRVFQFSRMLNENTEPASQELQTTAAKLARQLGLNTSPEILTTSAHVSPLVWWTGGKVRIVIPSSLLEEMDATEWRWIVAHELAHVQRRDYLIRWLEWLACVGFWWNPVVWWAQRNLRAVEEICCDALVLSSLQLQPRAYANSLFKAVEYLASSALRPPAMASEINSGGILERRFAMIVSENSTRMTSRWLQAGVLLCAVVVLPLGVVQAADKEAVGTRLKAAVEAAELTGEQARAMLGALHKADGAKHDPRAERAKLHLMKVKKELGVLMEAGLVGEQEATKRYKTAEQQIKKTIAAMQALHGEHGIPGEQGLHEIHEEHGSKRISNEPYRNDEAKIKKMVAAGVVSVEHARIRLSEMRQMMGAKKAAADIVKWKGITEQIEGAVKSGDLTREEANRKYVIIKKKMQQEKMHQEKKTPEKDWNEIKRRIEGAVERGDLTREEADAKYRELKD